MFSSMLSWTLGAFATSAIVGGLAYWLYLKRQVSLACFAEEAKASVEQVKGRQEAATLRRERETSAREAAMAKRVAADRAFSAEQDALFARREEIDRVARSVLKRQLAADARRQDLRSRKRVAKDKRTEAKKSIAMTDELRSKTVEAICKRTGETKEAVVGRLRQQLVERANSEAAAQVRNADKELSETQWAFRAQRLMAISVSRYRNHFMTERMISKIALPDRVRDILLAKDELCLRELSDVSNIRLVLQEDGGALRLEGLDGVGREVARRALARLAKKPDARKKAKTDPQTWARDIRTQLDQEIVGLGKKAFSVLEIPKPHADIVKLVGCLNFRTSFTQNQWLHAVEASFLAGMMAEELGLDVPLARRATLMHDIGKALTHEVDGSHAVIGADIARRLGEEEVVANAIGAHHADEPANSPYAYLVAGADAMSGARPGARREHSDGHSTRLQDLEKIGKSYPGVEGCFAVHGGRELRVYVNEKRLDDMGAVELSQDIAARVSDEMVFPGQIKVTIIRSTEAVAVAR